MASFLSKTISALLDAEKQLKTFFDKSKSFTKTSDRLKEVSSLKSRLGRISMSLDGPEISLVKCRKSLTSIINTLDGLENGLEKGLLDKTAFQKALKNLNSVFVSKYSRTVADLVRYIKEKNIDVSGSVYETDRDVVTSLSNCLSDLQKTSKHWSDIDGRIPTEREHQKILSSLERLADSVKERTLKMPASKQLDEVVQHLGTIFTNLYSIRVYVDETSSFYPAALAALTFQIGQLEDFISHIKKLIRLKIFEFTAELRKDIPKAILAAKQATQKDLSIADSPAAKAVTKFSPDEKILSRINALKGKRKDMPASIKTRYKIMSAPVVPIFEVHDTVFKKDRPLGGGTFTKNFTHASVLRSLGIRFVSLNDYLILEDQNLLLIDKAKMKTEVDLYNKTSRKKLKVGPKLFLDYARELLVNLKVTTGTEWSLVSDLSVANPRNVKITCFWIMHSSLLERLRSRGWAKTELNNWSFPF